MFWAYQFVIHILAIIGAMAVGLAIWDAHDTRRRRRRNNRI